MYWTMTYAGIKKDGNDVEEAISNRVDLFGGEKEELYTFDILGMKLSVGLYVI